MVDGPCAGGNATALEFCSADHPNIVIETVKKAEADDAVVVRMYEAGGARVNATLQFALPVASAAECNLLERQDETVAVEGNAISFVARPFEIKTFKVYLR